MADKQEQLLNYIESLPSGERLSVRNLARDLDVSDGTAYKAIKRAEILGLVETRPKSGTVRTAHKPGVPRKAVTLASLIESLGLTLLEGADYAETPIGPVLLGDGSLEQFERSVAAAGGAPLCLVGDRPEILHEAASRGLNIIATSGTLVNQVQLAIAAENHACVLSSEQDSLTLLGLLRAEVSGECRKSRDDKVSNWMRMPLYLYYNDIVADWHRLFRPIFSLCSKCAVVDDDLNICGTVDAINALAATPSRKISSLYSAGGGCFVTDEDTSMQDLADRMIAEGSATAYITRDNTLYGMITSNDVLRYYQHSGAGKPPSSVSGLQVIDRDRQAGRNVYTVDIPETENRSDTLFTVLVTAVRQHCEELFGKTCLLESGTFYCLNINGASGELMVSSEIINNTFAGCTAEAEIYNDAENYARCIFIVSFSGDGAANPKGV